MCKDINSLEKKLLLAKKQKKIYDVILNQNHIAYKVIFNHKHNWKIRFAVLNHIQTKYKNVLVSLNTENDLLIRHAKF
ncbi:hypothetical protein UFOVP410_118 [uncultured Caudovirales phage]|uniref:Uncharacterized protein n=1 Tax=uncultured Caudovirales phage TaxID=2100421 RepID=A0A6J5MC11_9CAUD|nr:hypothetical protein UFOVP410_118 [uncultured Caudovirales phage]